LVIGDITQNCADTIDTTTLSEIYGKKIVPLIAGSSSSDLRGRVGISFPYFSGDNMIPQHPWTSIGSYPASKSTSKRKKKRTCILLKSKLIICS